MFLSESTSFLSVKIDLQFLTSYQQVLCPVICKKYVQLFQTIFYIIK